MTQDYGLLLAQEEAVEAVPAAVLSPYTGDLLGRIDRCNAGQVERALAAAYAHFRARDCWLDVAQRVAVLERCAELMQQRFESLARGAAEEGGKPLVDSEVEVARAIDGVRLCIETIRTDVGTVVPMSEADRDYRRVAFTQKEPIGVVVAVSAFNHPLNLIVHQVAAAVAAGCPVLVKPAESTPLSCHRFVSLLRESGLPTAMCQLVMPETLDLATAMVSDQRVGFFSFIGSARVGWMLRSKLAPGTRCALEHGGAAPLIVDKSAQLDKLLPAILKGGYYHAGQVCVSVQRIFVHDSLFDAVAEKLVPLVKNLRVGDPLLGSTEVGPLISENEVSRVSDWIQEAVAEGASLACGGERIGNGCLQPALLLEPDRDSKVSRLEIFGPVTCLYRYQDLKSAIDQANALPLAFQAAVFAQDLDRAFTIAEQLDASAVMLNDHTAFRQDAMPFAGLRESGLGVGGISHTINDMQIEKMTVLRTRQA